MSACSFLVPDDFRAFMRSVVGYLDAPGTDKLLDAEDAFQDACGYGGRIDGSTRYRFVYLTVDGVHRWTIALDEHEIRAIADGLQIEAEGERTEVERTREREPSGQPLLIWGAYNDDALLVHSLDDLVIALDTLRRYATEKPRIVRMWSPSDDQLVAVLWGDDCALYVIESVEGYATSSGDPARTDSFEVLDHDGNPLIVPRADCVPWPAACRALIRFAAHGDLGPEIAVEGRIPSQLLMHGELDRRTVLAMRAEPAHDPRRSSLPRLVAGPGAPGAPDGPEPGADAGAVPSALVDPLTDLTAPIQREPRSIADLTAWGRRLIQVLLAQGLIELGPGPGIDEISYQLSGPLHAHGDEAEHALDTADWLANEISSIRGIARLFATGGDLQIALRRSRSPE
ncbi:MAG TPA: Imm1 family immunity protein [Kofleriaceae bacterium]|nr:Imm1 family immunity protein [Kofleriaceae bacterium]